MRNLVWSRGTRSLLSHLRTAKIDTPTSSANSANELPPLLRCFLNLTTAREFFVGMDRFLRWANTITPKWVFVQLKFSRPILAGLPTSGYLIGTQTHQPGAPMNSLSWFIYLIHVVDSIRGAIIFMIFAPLLPIGVWCIGGLIALDENKPKTLEAWKLWAPRWLYGVIIGAIVLAIFPSRETMLLIAGSEIGQRLVQSEGVRSVSDPSVTLLRTWIETETNRLIEEAAGRKKR